MNIVSTRCRLLLAAFALSAGLSGSPQLFAQEPDLLWSEVYGGEFWEKGYGGSPAGDGFIFVGYTESFGIGEADLYIVRVDPFGDTLWTRTHGGPKQDEGYTIERTEDGGFIVAGIFAHDSEESPGMAWILRLDEDGEMRWPYMQLNTDMYYRPNSVRETPGGNFVIVGNAMSLDLTTSGGWIAMIDANGQLLWSKTFIPDLGASFTSVDFTEDNGMVVVGYLGVSTNSDVDGWLLKMDAAGDTLWTKSYGGNSGDAFASVRVKEDGGIVCVGTTNSFGQGDSDILFVELKRTPIQDSLWIRPYGGNQRDFGNALYLTPDGGYVIAGTTERPGTNDFDAWVVRVGWDREFQWASRFGGDGTDEAAGVYPTEDGGYWVVGSSESFSTGPSDAWVLRLAAEPVSGVADAEPTAGGPRLDDPAPNPFNRSTVIQWHLETAGHVEIALQDLLGRPVRRLMDSRLPLGTYTTEWNGMDERNDPAPEGTYLCVISVNGQPLSSKKIVLTR